jgi:monoamine oxidase
MLGASLAVGAGSALAAAGPARAATGAAATPRTAYNADVVVVGAGLSGMAAAHTLAAAGKNVLVLEARDRVGGRTYDVHLANGGTVEAGAQFTGPTQTHLEALATALGVTTFQGYNTGNSIFYTNGTAIPYQGTLPPLPAATEQALFTALSTLDSLAATVPVTAPWNTPNAETLDAQTFSSWVLQNVSDPTVQSILYLIADGTISAEARDMSFLWFLFYVAAAGDENDVGTLERLTGTIGGARDSRFVGGPQQLSLKIAASLGAKVILNAPVTQIAQTSAGAVVSTELFSVAAGSVVVALPPTLAGRITYCPPLPAQRDQMTQRFPLSSVGKALAIYPTPFWRAAGLNGQAISDSGTARSTFDNSPPDASYGAIAAFIDGDNMRFAENDTNAQLEAAVLQDLTNYFGAQAATPEQLILLRWDSEQYTRGGAPMFTGPGVLTRYGTTIRPADGVIHWAGAEAGDYWAGHMEGAVRSGERAATEILNG